MRGWKPIIFEQFLDICKYRIQRPLTCIDKENRLYDLPCCALCTRWSKLGREDLTVTKRKGLVGGYESEHLPEEV